MPYLTRSLSRSSSSSILASSVGLTPRAASRPIASRGRARRSFLTADAVRGGRLVADVGQRISLRTPSNKRSPTPGRCAGEITSWELEKVDAFISTHAKKTDTVLPEMKTMATELERVAHEAWDSAVSPSWSNNGFVDTRRLETRLEPLRSPASAASPH